MSEQTTGWDALVELGEVADALPEGGGGVVAFLNWADREAQDIEAERLVLAQDEEAEERRHEERKAALAKRKAKLAERVANLGRGALLHKAALCPGKKQSRELPSGLVLSFRRHGDRVVVRDRAALMAWARAEPERMHAVLRASTSYEPSKAGLEVWVGQHDVPPGVVVEPAGEDFDVTVAKKKGEG